MLFDFQTPFTKNTDFELMYIFMIIALSLLIGFVFQIMTKFIRNNSNSACDTFILGQVVHSNESIFNKAKNILKTQLSIDPESMSSIELVRLMDNKLNVNQTAKLPYYFSFRTSLWGNVFWANLLLVFLGNCSFYLLFIIMLFIAGYGFYSNLRAQFDTIIKSFVMSS